MNKVWTCKIGATTDLRLPDGADEPMREAVETAFKSITGVDAEFCFSGWGGELEPVEIEVVDEARQRKGAQS